MTSASHSQRPRVVITGIGAVSPVGNNAEDMWKALVAGQSGVSTITSFDTKDYDVKIAAEVKGFDATQYVTRKQALRMDRFSQFAVAASLQAVKSANFTVDDSNAQHCGVIIGNCVGGLLSVCDELKILAEKGPGRVSPILGPTMIPDASSVQVSIILGTKGINYAPSSACSSSADAIGQAYETIMQGHARAMIAGGTEAPIIPLVIAAFTNIRALSMRNNDPAGACRPFDGDRDGFVMGEGSGILLLEDAEYAERRGAPIIAELVGYASTSDSFHLTQPAPDGVSAARAMRTAMERANIRPEEVQHINAHGTATLLNDRTETTVIKSVFGDHAKKIPITANKSMVGHSIGGSGSIEAVVTAMTIRDGIIPPTINQHTPDPLCDLDYTPNVARKANIRTAISNSFGFGGHNSVLIMRKWEG
jgi:beta-ketoacyl-acyl-carrier-protein synthase II